jgi:effector-binding domain-containing protein
MKVLKIIGIVILVIVLIVVVLALIAPKNYEVSRSIVINADKDVVFRNMQYWRYWGAWSPWAENDSTMKITIEGVDGQVDSKYIWEGDPKVTGSGEMVNTGVIEGEEMTYHLYFKTPWESHSNGWVRVKEVEGGTEASWGFYGEYPIPMNIMLLFMPMDKMIGPDFERGMQLLKETVEEQAGKIASMVIQEIRYSGTKMVAIRKEIKMSDMKEFFSSSYAAINQAMQANGALMTGAPSAIYYKWDEENGVADVAAGIPTFATVNDGDVETINVPGSNALAVEYRGPYEDIELAHMALMKYLQDNNVPMGELAIEEYLSDPGSVPDPNQWLTRVLYFIQ